MSKLLSTLLGRLCGELCWHPMLPRRRLVGPTRAGGAHAHRVSVERAQVAGTPATDGAPATEAHRVTVKLTRMAGGLHAPPRIITSTGKSSPARSVVIGRLPWNEPQMGIL